MSECIAYDWHPFRRTICYAFAVGLAAAAFGCFWLAREAWVFNVVGVLFAAFSIGMLCDQRTFVDRGAGIIQREVRLFGTVLLWRSERLLTEFVAVGSKSTNAQDGNTIFVGLVPKKGRLFSVRYFSSRYEEAELFANRLSQDTGLPLAAKVTSLEQEDRTGVAQFSFAKIRNASPLRVARWMSGIAVLAALMCTFVFAFPYSTDFASIATESSINQQLSWFKTQRFTVHLAATRDLTGSWGMSRVRASD
jgi:hypothetical protein